ncbi:MAG: hypothetical protein ACXQT3_06285 [Methermicoccaceae archaeon]
MKREIANRLPMWCTNKTPSPMQIAEDIMREVFLPWLKAHSNMGTVMAFEDEIERR